MTTSTKNPNAWEMAIPLSINVPGRGDAYWHSMIAKIKKMGCTRVFLATMSEESAPSLEEFRSVTARYQQIAPWFSAAGIEPDIWLGHSIGHGGPELDGVSSNSCFTRIVCGDDHSIITTSSFCPLGDEFTKYICSAVAILAECKPPMLMIDDDFRLCLHGAQVGCLCDLHLALIGKELGHPVTAKEVLSGIKTDRAIRKAWRKANGDSLYSLASAMEKAIHAVSPDTRFGLAGEPFFYRWEGIDLAKMSEIMAGKSVRPFFRTGSAPYWSRLPNDTGWQIENTRLMNAMGHAHNQEIEIFAEGDTYPHNTFVTGAANLEAFHEGLEASGIQGILSYQFSYGDDASTDENYQAMTMKLAGFHQAIRKISPPEWNEIGFEPIVSPDGFLGMEPALSSWDNWQELSSSLKVFPRLGLPIAYQNARMPVILSSEETGELTNEEIKAAIKRGAVIDAPAAETVLKRGFSLGIDAFARTSSIPTSETCNGIQYLLRSGGENLLWTYHPGPNATVKSTFGDKLPGISFIDLKEKGKIVLLPWNLAKAPWINLHFGHQALLQDAFNFLAGFCLPARIVRHADLRLHIRQSPNAEKLAVTLQNTSVDPFQISDLQLADNYEITGILLPGSIQQIPINSLPNDTLHPLEMTIITLKKK